MSGVPISFLSDFGGRDEFVGVVHGVIERIAPGTRVIDVSHGVDPGDVRGGALMLLRAIQYLPDGVVLAMVAGDTGVRMIAVDTPRGVFVGPDNGLLAPAVAIVGGGHRFFAIEAVEFRLPVTGRVSVGRDVLAPAAAVLASREAAIDDLGPEVAPGSVTPLLLPLVEHEEGRVSGEIWWIDRFGTAQTNVSPDDLRLIGLGTGAVMRLRVGATEHQVTWAEGPSPDRVPVVHVDAHGLIAIAGGSGERLGLHEGLSVGFRAGE